MWTIHRIVICIALVSGLCVRALSQEIAPRPIEFPPGLFSDGVPLRVSDCRGKVVVLCFYDPTSPEGWGDPQTVRWLVSEMQDQPVKFVAVVPGWTIEQVATAPADMPEIPAFADTLRVMENRAGGSPSNSSQWRYTVIGPDGNLVGQHGEDFDHAATNIAKVLPTARWNYRTKSTPAKLRSAFDRIECGQLAAGGKLLGPFFSDHDIGTSRAARALYDQLRKDARGWQAQAAVSEKDSPIGAYDQHSRVATLFANEQLGRASLQAMRKIENRRDVRAEFAARAEYQKLDRFSHAPNISNQQAIELCRHIASNYAGTPTASEASALADEVAGIPPLAPTTRPAPQYIVRISDFDGAGGSTLLYRLTPDAIVVASLSDWAGVRPKEHYRAALSDAQRNSIQSFLRTFPLNQLQDSYTDPSVNDGFQCTFDFRIAGLPHRTIFVGNRRQRDLEGLCDEINRLVPEKLKIGMPRSSFRAGRR